MGSDDGPHGVCFDLPAIGAYAHLDPGNFLASTGNALAVPPATGCSVARNVVYCTPPLIGVVRELYRLLKPLVERISGEPSQRAIPVLTRSEVEVIGAIIDAGGCESFAATHVERDHGCIGESESTATPS